MNGIMKENVINKKYEFNNPLLQKIICLIVNSFIDCHNKYFHTFDHICEYDLNFTKIGNNETVNFTISDKSMGLYEINKQITIARRNGYIFNQINKLKTKSYSNLSNINTHYYLQHRFPILHRHFSRELAQNRE